VTDSKIINRINHSLLIAEHNQEEIEQIIQEILELGNSLLIKVEDFKDDSFVQNYKKIFHKKKLSDPDESKAFSTKTPFVRFDHNS